MKRVLSMLLLISVLIPFTYIFGIGGLGLQVGQSIFSVAESMPPTEIDNVTLTNGSFDGAYSLGGYLYIDAIPFIDIEVDANIKGNTYDIKFKNLVGEIDPIAFAWTSTDVFLTLRKKVFGLSVGRTWWPYPVFNGWLRGRLQTLGYTGHKVLFRHV